MLVQDGATAHTSRKTIEFCNHHKIPIITQSPRSPDLNSIEMVWGYIKKTLSLRFSKIKE